jgi:hypothetical protein
LSKEQVAQMIRNKIERAKVYRKMFHLKW